MEPILNHAREVVIALFLCTFAYSLFEHILSWRSWRNPVPENVKDVYDGETYQKWKEYHAEKSRISLLETILSFAVDLFLLAGCFYSAFANLFPKGDFWQMVSVFILSLLSLLVTLPFSYYDQMVIEEKYGFNRTTRKLFWVDTLKSTLISTLVMVGLGSLLMGTHKVLGDWMIVVFSLAVLAFVLFVSFLYPFLSRIFNKYTPLEEGELKDQLMALLEKYGYRVRAIQVMDASKRSTRSNAFFTGFGKTKTIVLYDTLVASMTPEEICAVFAHEMGHGLHKDTLKNQILSFFEAFLIGALAWMTVRTPELFTAFGFPGVNYGFAILLVASIEMSFFTPLLDFPVNLISRCHEYRADAVAVAEGYGEALIQGLKKLARDNFSNLSPSPLLVALEYSHPTLSQRIDAIQKRMEGLPN